ncbi:MAG: PAS domain S-box protein [Halobacteriales archaeon]|nr:PAS domain S-box protein [Halobacteriales archaeon]
MARSGTKKATKRSLGATADTIEVLHVDDDPDYADLTARCLERENEAMEVETATSVSDGLTMVTEREFDCIVSDYDMPGRDGIEFLRSVREEYPDLPFILYTGKGSEGVASDAISAGVTDYLKKETGTSDYTVLANRITNAVEQYRTKREAEASQQRLSLFFEQSPLGVIEWNEEFEFVRVNAAAEDILGYSEDELIGASWQKIVPESDWEPVTEVVDDLLEAEGGFYSVNENVTKSGERIRCEWHNRVVTDDDGDVIAVFSQFRDVTEQKEREEKLRQTTARLEVLFEESPDMINIHDPDGNIINPNPRLCQETGYDATELTEMKVWELDRSIEPAEAASLWESMQPGDSHRVEGEYQRQDGSTIPVEIHIRRLRLDGEDRFIAFARDITERKEREQELRKERAFIEQSLNALDDVFYVFSPDGEILRWNDRISEVTGYTDAEIEDMAPTDFFPEDEQAHIADGVQEIFETGSAIRRADYLTKDGDRIPYEFSGVRLTDSDGEIIGFVGVGRDITDQLAKERQLRRQNKRLEEFAGVVSHDLRTPLNVIKGRVDLAKDDCDSEHLDTIETAANRMGRIIEDVLVLAQGEDDIDATAPVEVRGAIETAWELTADDTDGAELRFVDENSRLPTIDADIDRFQQLLKNLLQNAVDHSDDSVTITVGTLEDGFYIEDDGPGIPSEDRDEVFEAGYSTADGGTGFGLCIVEQIAEAHGWDIRVTDGADGGARFEITAVEFAT